VRLGEPRGPTVFLARPLERDRVTDVQRLKQQNRVPAAETGVQDHSADRQPPPADLFEQEPDDLVRLGLRLDGQQADGEPPPLVDQDGGGVRVELVGPLLARPAGDAGRARVAVVGDQVGVDGHGPVAAAVPAAERGDGVQGVGQAVGEDGGRRQGAPDSSAAVLGRERAPGPGDGEQGPDGGGHQDEQVNELVGGDRPLVPGQLQGAAEDGPQVGVDGGGGAGRMARTHGELPCSSAW